MKYKIAFLLLFLTSCSAETLQNKKSTFTPYSSKGFALIYDESDYKNKKISRKLNENELEIGHNKIRKNSTVIITNPENNKSIRLKVSKRVKYPDFFKVLITKSVSQKLELNADLPFVDIEERVKNKSFVAKKAVTFSEEKNVLTKIPVDKIKIDNISQKKNNVKNQKKIKKYSIIVGDFYSKNWADNLIDLLINEGIKKEVFKVKKLTKNKYQLTAGPYSSINTLKNDYFKLNKYGFENLDIKQK